MFLLSGVCIRETPQDKDEDEECVSTRGGPRTNERERDRPFNFLVLKEIKEAGLILPAEAVRGNDK